MAGSNGRIAIVDTATLRIVSYWQVPGSTDNIASLAVAGNYLYVAEGGRYTAGDGAHRLMRVNIDETSSDFMQAQKIDLQGAVAAPYGFFDLAILKGGKHGYLAVTASQSNLPLTLDNQATTGQVFVLDLNALVENGKTLTANSDAIRVIRFEENKGKGPQYISPASVKIDDKNNPTEARFLLSNALDYNSGVVAVSVKLNADGSFKDAANDNAKSIMTSMSGLRGGLSNILGNKYQMNVQRAQGAVYYYDKTTKTEYALVADYYMPFNDPGYPDSLAGKQAGGKVGVIKDPFGEADYLGSTTPIVGASFKDLNISPDGKTLLGNLVYWEDLPSGVLSWNLSALIEAANKNSLSGQITPRPIPFDRDGSVSSNPQIVIPTKYEYGGFVFGMASNVTTPVVQAGTSHYGDIARVDIVKAVQDYLAKNGQPGASVSGFNNKNLEVDSGSKAYAKILTYNFVNKNGSVEERKVSGAKNLNLKAVSAASDKSYTGEFNDQGVFFLSAQFTPDDLEKLRKGERLPDDRKVLVRISGLTVDGKADQSYLIEINLNDCAETAGHSVFFGDRPLDDPGYTKFELSGVVSKANVVDRAAEALDVWRVEQRLTYLAFPAMGYDTKSSYVTGADGKKHISVSGPRDIQNFTVDGKFEAKEAAALRLFEKVVRYGTGIANRQFALASPGADGIIEADGNNAQAKLTTDWLNAYNAPHWMNIGAQMQYQGPRDNPKSQNSYSIAGWDNTQNGKSSANNVETYGTSWMRDLLVAESISAASVWALSPIVTANGQASYTFLFNGAVDANLGATPTMHVTHDLGMAFDFGVSSLINPDGAQKEKLEKLTLDIDTLQNTWVDSNDHTKGTLYSNIPNKDAYNATDPAKRWSYANAVYLSGLLIDSTDPLNNQREALSQFLSLYALTRSDSIVGNGTWDDLPVKNGAEVRSYLFGSGSQVGDLISKVHIGGGTINADGSLTLINGQNPYQNINEILKRLGIDATPVKDHQNHFHIYLNPPTPKKIGPDLLLAGALSASSTDSMLATTDLQTSAQGLLDYAENITEGEELMFIMDVPYVPVQETSIVLSQASIPGGVAPAGATAQPDYLLKTCSEFSSGGGGQVDPAYMLKNFLQDRDNKYIELASIKTTLLEGTKHGKLSDGKRSYNYAVEPGYLGNDKAVFMAEFEGKHYKVVINFVITEAIDENSPQCTEPQLIKVNGKPVSGSSGSDLNAISVSIADLVGGALGQTTGTSITLDDNAAGHNWFIDSTPADNSEFLPTSNPYEWVAKEGTAAYGKMDMLSVLLHEYGHVLGIEHSADGHDYMATTLTAGVRRLPSAEELALMQQLVGEVKVEMASVSTQGSGNTPSQLPLLPLGGFGLAFLGRLRGTRYGSLNVEADLSTLVTQFAVTANAKLTNGNFSVASGMPVDNGWATQGSVDFVGGAATLKETSTSQTRLNQVFVVNPRDRFLSFTIAGSVLDDVNGAPDDAFEVALLDANTGLSLAGAFSLTHTDAMLNIQADGTETAASSVTRVTNPDGSRTYRVDLAGIAVGTAVNLSFDLIGFGKDNSEVTIRDVRVSGLPVLHDDAATMNEDGSLAFDPFAQVDNAALLQLGSHVVDQPAHGTVTVNADGTFAYSPAANYFGSDSFTYRLNDGPLESNLATVSVSIAAVNDAPVAGDVYATLAEDTPLQITLGNFATDVDSTTLSIQIVDGPSHGVLVANADGSYTYTPEANYFGADSFTYKANDSELDSNIATVSLNITPVNDAPVANDVAVYTLEDNQLVLNLLSSASDIDSPVDAQVFTATIVAAPAHGVLSWNTDGSYTYTPDANYNGADSFTYVVNDGELDSNIATVSLTVGSVNDAPEGISNTVTTLEDTPYVFQLADFGYSDANDLVGAQASRLQADGTSAIQWDNFIAVTIGSLPQAGNLTLDGVAVVAGQSISTADIAAGLLAFAPAANANSAAYANFTFNVQDDGGTANGGIDIDQTARTMTLNVTSVNDAPEGISNTVTTLEDTPYVFQLADFGYSDANDLVGAQASRLHADGTSAIQWDNFSAVTIGNLPQEGNLTLNGLAVAAGQSISSADITAGLLVFASAANANGTAYANFTFNVQDDGGTANGGIDIDQTERTMTLNVTSVNDAPEGLDNTVTTLEDTPYVFQLADFGYSDSNDLVGAQASRLQADGMSAIRWDNFTAVTISSLPLAGELSLNGLAVAAGQRISVAEIAAGLLKFAPAANANGASYASFSFQVQDDGGTANGGIDIDQTARTMTLNVTSVNDAPEGLDNTVTTLEDTPYVFQLADFGYSDANDLVGAQASRLQADGTSAIRWDNFTAVTISNLPLAGELSLNGLAVAAGQRISVAEIAAGLLKFAPAANANGASYASFTFQVQDDGGTANGGVDTDQTARTMSIAVTAVNDAPVAVDMQAATDEDTPLTLNLLANVIDIDSAALTPIIIAGPQHGQLLYNADGSFNYVSDLDYFGTDSFTYKVNDAAFAGDTSALDSNIVTVSLTINAVNDAPVAISSAVTGSEDTPYVFSWSDFKVSDVDSTDLGITVNNLPADGLLQHFNGIEWLNLTTGQRVTKADIDAGLLCFGPDLNESGFAGYSAMGTGNNLSNYASFTYQADDGFLTSAIASMSINIVPVVDEPALALAAPVDEFGATALLFGTSWEAASNRNQNFTLLHHGVNEPRGTLEGWNVVQEVLHDDDHHHDDHGQDAFILWSSGDKMQHAKQDKDHDRDGKDCDHDDDKGFSVVQAAAGNGNNWLELGDAMGQGHQTYGIERAVSTRAGVTYMLSLDYAGRLGYSADYTRIGIYVDGVQIATHAGTSPNEALNWEALNFRFTGTGAMQTIRIVTEGTASEKNGRGAMIDDIVLIEAMPINSGYEGGAIRLSAVIAQLTDTDGSEVIGVTVGAIPTGAVLSDGVNSFTASDNLHLVDISNWNITNLSITAPIGFTGTFALTVAATATETATGETASYALNLPVTVVQRIALSLPASQAAEQEHHDKHEHDDMRGCEAIKATAYADARGHLNLLDNGGTKGDGWTAGKDGYDAIDSDTGRTAGKPDDRCSSASITLRSAQPQQILGFPAGNAYISALNHSEDDDKSGSHDPSFATGKAQSNAVIDWNVKSNSVRETSEDLHKTRKGAANWFKDFLGLAEPVSLTESSGLSVTQQKAEETKQPFVERRRAVNADGSRVKNER